MTVAQRRLREKEALRNEILAAARDMFAEQGYENVSMRKIADRIEYSPTAIYLHFQDKQSLFEGICEETFTKLDRALGLLSARLASGKATPMDLLRKGLQTYVTFGLEHPNHYRLAFLTKGPEVAVKDPASAAMRAFGHLASSVEAAMATGDLKRGDVAEISQALWAGVHGVTSLLILHPEFPFVARKKLVARVIDSMVEGMRAR